MLIPPGGAGAALPALHPLRVLRMAGDASRIQTVRLGGSIAYRMRAPPVSSYCHCSSVLPPMIVVLSPPRSWCCRSERAVGSDSRLSNARRVGPGNWLTICSQPSAAEFPSKRNVQPPGGGGGGTRPPRLVATGPSAVWARDDPARARVFAPHRGGKPRVGVHEGRVLPLVEQHRDRCQGPEIDRRGGR